MSRTLIPKAKPGIGAAILSGLLALAAVALIAYGVWTIYPPAGIIVAGLGCAVLQWQFFGGRE